MTEATARTAISPTAAVEHALKLLPTQPALAERQAREILKVLPHDARALFIVGAALRRAGDAGGARVVLEPLARAVPDSAYAHHELGLALAGLGESAAALDELRRAAELERGLPHVWLSLHDHFSLTGDEDGAAAAYSEHIRASLKDPNLLQAAEALRDGRLMDAQRTLKAHLERFPTDVSAMRMMGETAARLNHFEVAEELLLRCLELAPKFVGARHNYALVLFQQNKPHEAIRELDILLADAPGDVKYLPLLAACMTFIGDYQKSLELLERVLAEHPKQARLWMSYGQTLRTTGRGDDAVNALKRAIALNPSLGEAYWSLADIKTRRFGDAEITAMRRQLADSTLRAGDRLHLHYALGKALEDSRSWAESFEHYAAGAALRRAEQPHDADENTAWVERCKAVFTEAFFAEREEGGREDPAPIFVLGLPRSGSTLLEQILAAHSKVEATLELPDIAHLTNRVSHDSRKSGGPEYPEAAAQLSAEMRTALGDEFIRRTLPFRRLGRAFFLDKMPSNFFHVGFIRLILPRAKIIDIRRHPMAACFSAFKQHFFRGQNYTYDLTDLGRYYRDYVALMEHFDRVMPGRIHRVIYEELVDDTETEIRRLLAYCGLDFEPACLRFWETGRAVSTHSSEQVRRPIFRDALDQWRHYEPWLAPLEAALGPALESWRPVTR